MKRKVMVAIIIGSKSDREKIQPCLDVLNGLGISWELSVISSHRHPEKLSDYAQDLVRLKIKVVIAAAGMAAHLPGMLAGYLRDKKVIVIGIALSSKSFPHALDSLFSMTRMPSGVPLVCAGIDEAGVKNAALFTAKILSFSDERLEKRLTEFFVKEGKEKPSIVRSETSISQKGGRK